jgi:hypothetical protein
VLLKLSFHANECKPLPGGTRNCVRWMDEGERLVEEAAERRREELRAGFSARDKNGLQAGAYTRPLFGST